MRETQDSSQLPSNQSPARSPQIYRRQRLMSSVYLSDVVEQRGHLLLTVVGYGSIVFGAIDYAHILFPPHFTDPVWELQTIAELAEHAAMPLIGLVLIFYRYEGEIWELERKLLGAISWVALLTGVLYFLMLPLGMNDTWRLYQSMNNQISMELSQKSQQIQQVKSQLDGAKTPEQLQQVLANVAPQQQLAANQNFQVSKDKLLNRVSQVENDIRLQANNARTSQTNVLLKSTVKSHLGALVAGTLFVLCWYLTDWARNF